MGEVILYETMTAKLRQTAAPEIPKFSLNKNGRRNKEATQRRRTQER